MLIDKCRGDSVCQTVHCGALAEVAGTISDLSAVWFDRGDACVPGGVIALSRDGTDLSGLRHKKEVPAQAAGALQSVTPLDPFEDKAAARLRALTIERLRGRADEPARPDLRWAAFECAFEDGTRDIILIRTTESDADIGPIFRLVWPGLRRICLRDMTRALDHLSDEAMLWLVRRKVNASVLVLDEDCNLLSANAAGTDLLKNGDFLQVSAGRLRSVNERATAGLHRIVQDVYQAAEADGNGNGKEYVLLLRSRDPVSGQDSRQPVPMTLTPFRAADGRRVLIALLPMPPQRKGIERLARKMGLTPSEARVAALIRAGHSNREAARIAGLKVETFNTYAKRALAKMNVSGRAELAQMLTWQAAVDRPS